MIQTELRNKELCMDREEQEQDDPTKVEDLGPMEIQIERDTQILEHSMQIESKKNTNAVLESMSDLEQSFEETKDCEK